MHSRRGCKINVALAWKAIKGSSIPLSCSQKSQRDMDHPRHSDSGKTAGSAIENYKSSKRKSQRSHVVERMEVQASMAKAGKNPPPPRGRGEQQRRPSTTVTPKTALPQGVTERQIVFTAHQEPSWAVDWRYRNGSRLAPCKCASYAQSCAFMKRAGPLNYVKQSETPLSYVVCCTGCTFCTHPGLPLGWQPGHCLATQCPCTSKANVGPCAVPHRSHQPTCHNRYWCLAEGSESTSVCPIVHICQRH